MTIFNLILVAGFLLMLAVPGLQAQAPGGRESAPADEANRPPRITKGHASSANVKRRGRQPNAASSKPRKVTPATAALTIRVTPVDSTINVQGVDYRVENGFFLRDNLAPGKYNVAIRRDGYKRADYEINIGPGSRTPLSVTLERLSGVLNVSPLVADTEINIIDTATGKSVGFYFGRVRQAELLPGQYQVFISKKGYKSAVREVVVEPSANLFLEPSLTPLPRPAPIIQAPAALPFRRDYATHAQTRLEGKFIVVTLTGRSGDTVNAVGAIDVTLGVGGGSAQTTNISGMLTGYPCQVDFVRLENVAEYSFVEPPGAANQWARAVVRLRPKESKRPVHFLINWRSLRHTAPASLP